MAEIEDQLLASAMAKSKKPVTYDEVFKYLSNNEEKYAEGCTDNRKRAIRKFSEGVCLESGILHYLQYEDKSKKVVKLKRQWISSKSRQKQILESIHDNTSGGCHFGRDKTRDKVIKRYFWHGIYEDIDAYVKTCVKCQKVASGLNSEPSWSFYSWCFIL